MHAQKLNTNDYIHAVIERASRPNTTLYRAWYIPVSRAIKSKQAYKVIELSKEDFVDYMAKLDAKKQAVNN